ncbi:hypothetical protein GCM10023311_15340 [Flaviramulus aquimarinus]|uniref:Secretion system C-terminal sorting domain-containing protein n=1 Tax=Flaviramulus aquimarinus TaxID=1170456 RepID=A0ABP9F169_9FLAO
MKHLLLVLVCPIFLFSQTQIGNNIVGESADDALGESISLSADGTILAIGSSDSGYVKVFENQSGIWSQIGLDIENEIESDSSGKSVSLSEDGSIIAIGAPKNYSTGNNSGHVRIYKNQSGVWTQIGNDIIGEAIEDESGRSVSISSDGNIVAIGAPYNNDNGIESGHVRVFENQSGVWTQIGNDIDGQAAGDLSGNHISLSADGTTVAIGATGNDWNGNNSGDVRVFKNESGEWIQIGNSIYGEVEGDEFGGSVSLSADGKTIAIGAPYNDGNGNNSGHVKVYQLEFIDDWHYNCYAVYDYWGYYLYDDCYWEYYATDTWVRLGSVIDGEAENDQSGRTVSLSSDGTILAIGATGNDANGNNSGHVRIYQNQSGVWNQLGSDINGEAAGDLLAYSLSISANSNVLAIGAVANNSWSGQVKVYNLSTLLSIDEFTVSQLSLYPNPANNQFTIQLSNNLQLQNVNIYNSLGQFLISDKNRILKINNLSPGMYFVEIETNKGKVSKKLMVE